MASRIACYRLLLSLVLAFPLFPAVWAQDSAPATEADEAKPAAEQFDQAFSQWKNLLFSLRELRAKYQNAEESELEAIRGQWNELIAEGEGAASKLRAATQAAYLESPNENRQVTRLLIKFVADNIRADQYEAAAELSKMLLDNQCNEKEIEGLAGIAAFATHDFEAAGENLEAAASSRSLPTAGQTYLGSVADYKAFWAEELELRTKEAEADDLPRVKLTTSKGDIVLELFENEAPQTVGNFVSLVEKGFYDNLTFHRVLQGFMAQGGCPDGDGSGGPGYSIYCECYQKNHRKHFRGSLSMAKAVPKDTGGSQFFLTFVPTSNLNGKHTVFGRVIKGIEVLSKLQRRDPTSTLLKPTPDKIVEAEVLRKRDHAYVPTKVQ